MKTQTEPVSIWGDFLSADRIVLSSALSHFKHK